MSSRPASGAQPGFSNALVRKHSWLAQRFLSFCAFVNNVGHRRRINPPLAGYCKKNGINFEEILKGRMVGWNYERYAFLNFTGSTPDALRIKSLGRFGNACTRIWNALIIAKALGIKTVVIPKDEMWKPASLGPMLELRVMEEADFMRLEGQSVLDGDLLTTRPFRKALTKLSLSDRQLIVKNYLEPCARAYACSVEVISSEDLVLHFRSGDIFGKSSKVHSAYLQPPLAYYQICLQHHLQRHPSAGVHLVYEDRGNPCIQAMESHLDAIQVPWKSSSSDLRSDLSFLMTATTIVWGIGTFGRGVSLCSEKLRVCYNFFNQPFDETKPYQNQIFGFKLKAAWAVYDEGRGYIPPGTWKNREPQRATMLGYPLSALAIKENRPVARAGLGR